MKLFLKNFKCYQEHLFEINDSGLTLISGKSGAGKTSILDAIFFALYGEGTDLIMDTKSSCKVQLTINPTFTVTRTKRPNRLVVKRDEMEYEDTEAQNIINDIYGTAYSTCGYISQDAFNSFILMSPTNKLSFIEQFAFHGIDLHGMKNRCNDQIKHTKTQVEKNKTEINTLSSVVDSIKIPPQVDFPIKYKNPKNIPKLIRNEQVKYKNTKVLLKRAKQQLDTLSNLLIVATFIDTKKDEINHLKLKLKDLEDKRHEYQDIIHGIDIEKYETMLKYILQNKEIIYLKKDYQTSLERLDTMKTEELDTMKDQIKTISLSLWSEYNREELDSTVIEYEAYIKDLERLKDLMGKYTGVCLEDLQDIRSSIEEKNNMLANAIICQNSYKCPECDTELRLDDGKLCRVNKNDSLYSTEEIEHIRHDIKTLKSKEKDFTIQIQIKKEMDDIISTYQDLEKLKKYSIESLKPILLDIKQDLKYLLDYRAEQLHKESQLEDIQQRLDKNIFSNTITSFARKVDKTLTKIKTLETSNTTTIDDDEENIREKINTYTTHQSLLKNIQSDIDTITKDISAYTQQIKSKSDTSDTLDTPILQEKISAQKTQIDDYEKELDILSQNIERIKEYIDYKKVMKENKQWQDKLDQAVEDSKIYLSQYQAALAMREKISKTESLCMTQVIDRINTHAQMYLDEFFPDDPITVTILPFKTTKTSTKPQLNIEVDYRGNTCGLSRLSGGQKSRIVLAFTLALAEVSNVPLLMLDECTSSLDEELNTVVMETLKRYFTNKMVLIIAHQQISGLFDHVIKL